MKQGLYYEIQESVRTTYVNFVDTFCQLAIKNDFPFLTKLFLRFGATVKNSGALEYAMNYAINKNDTSVLDTIFDYGSKFDPNEVFQDGTTSFDLALKNDALEIVHKLIKEGASVADSKVMHVAIVKNDVELLKTLIDKSEDFDINKPMKEGINPLNYALQNNAFESANFFINNGAIVNWDAALNLAIIKNEPNLLQTILSNGKDEIDVNENLNDGSKPLNYALQHNAILVAQILIKEGAKISESDALSYSISMKDIDLLNTILNALNGQDIKDLMVDGINPLLFAIRHGSLEVIRTLIDAGISIAESDALHEASRMNNIKALNLILHAGKDIDLNHPDSNNLTPLQYATLFKSYDAFKLLISAGAKPTLPLEISLHNYFELLNYPLSLTCKLENCNQDSLSKLLSHTYSKVIAETDLHNSLQNINKDPLIDKIFTAVTSIKNYTIEIVDSIKEHFPLSLSHSGNDLHYENRIIIEMSERPSCNGDKKQKFLSKEIFIQELTRKIIKQLFNNADSSSKPYNTDEEKIAYEQATKDLWDNVQTIFKQFDNTEVYLEPLLDKSTSFKYIINIKQPSDQPQNACLVYAIYTFLNNQQNFKPQEAQEQILLQYPSFITQECYHDNEEVKKLFEPIKTYWDNFVDPKLDEYFEQSNHN